MNASEPRRRRKLNDAKMWLELASLSREIASLYLTEERLLADERALHRDKVLQMALQTSNGRMNASSSRRPFQPVSFVPETFFAAGE